MEDWGGDGNEGKRQPLAPGQEASWTRKSKPQLSRGGPSWSDITLPHTGWAPALKGRPEDTAAVPSGGRGRGRRWGVKLLWLPDVKVCAPNTSGLVS